MRSNTSAGLIWMLFGGGLAVSSGVGLRTGADVLVGVGRIVRPEGTVLGLRYAADEEPRWVLGVLAVAGLAMLVGTTITIV